MSVTCGADNPSFRHNSVSISKWLLEAVVLVKAILIWKINICYYGNMLFCYYNNNVYGYYSKNVLYAIIYLI